MNLQPQEITCARPRNTTQDERLEAAVKADQCVKWLEAQGFDVVQRQTGRRNPRVIIRGGPLCESLEGAVRMYERLGQTEKRYWVAIRFDCEVRWTDPSTSSGQAGNGGVA